MNKLMEYVQQIDKEKAIEYATVTALAHGGDQKTVETIKSQVAVLWLRWTEGEN